MLGFRAAWICLALGFGGRVLEAIERVVILVLKASQGGPLAPQSRRSSYCTYLHQRREKIEAKRVQ